MGNTSQSPAFQLLLSRPGAPSFRFALPDLRSERAVANHAAVYLGADTGPVYLWILAERSWIPAGIVAHGCVDWEPWAQALRAISGATAASF